MMINDDIIDDDDWNKPTQIISTLKHYFDDIIRVFIETNSNLNFDNHYKFII